MCLLIVNLIRSENRTALSLANRARRNTGHENTRLNSKPDLLQSTHRSNNEFMRSTSDSGDCHDFGERFLFIADKRASIVYFGECSRWFNNKRVFNKQRRLVAQNKQLHDSQLCRVASSFCKLHTKLGKQFRRWRFGASIQIERDRCSSHSTKASSLE